MSTISRSSCLWLSVLLVVTACEKSGRLTVENFSNKSVLVDVQGFEPFRLATGEDWEHEFALGKRFIIFGPDDKNVDVRAEGEFVYRFFRSAKIEADGNAFIDIRSNAGIVRIDNRSSFDITAVRIAAAGDSIRATNWLDAPITSNTTRQITLFVGIWQMVVIDVEGRRQKWSSLPIDAEDINKVVYLR